jgi:N-methylhydantoinase A
VAAASSLSERFHVEHDRTYGFGAPGEAVELVSVRVATVGRIAKPPRRRLAAAEAPEPKERRPVYFAEAGGYADCPVYDRYTLGAGASFAGPAIVEEFDSTVVVHPGYRGRIDDAANLYIEKEDV